MSGAKIIRGLQDAIKYAKGKSSGGKAAVYKVRHGRDRAIVSTKGKPDRIVPRKP